jgi:predicted ArsR family transcriptional regulator
MHPLRLALDLEIHVNTVRRHLEILESGGEVRRTPEAGGQPGRPRVLYERVEVHADPACAGHRFLARALASYVAGTHGDPATAGLASGEAWGGHLVAAEPFTRSDVEDALERAFAVLDELGYEPSRHEFRIEEGVLTSTLGRCPFPELATAFPGLICNFHVGLVRGALGRLGANLDVDVSVVDGGIEGGIEGGTPSGICLLRYRPLDAQELPRHPPERTTAGREPADPG